LRHGSESMQRQNIQRSTSNIQHPICGVEV
jgi:hypothetical protein